MTFSSYFSQLMDSDDGVDSLAAALALLSNIDIRMRAQGLVTKIVIGGNYMYNVGCER